MAARPHPTLDPLADKLRQVHTIPALVQYLRDELGWPVNVNDCEDNLFDGQSDELNLKAAHEVKVKSIKQLRPWSAVSLGAFSLWSSTMAACPSPRCVACSTAWCPRSRTNPATSLQGVARHRVDKSASVPTADGHRLDPDVPVTKPRWTGPTHQAEQFNEKPR